jgi:hypothetical protein
VRNGGSQPEVLALEDGSLELIILVHGEWELGLDEKKSGSELVGFGRVFVELY